MTDDGTALISLQADLMAAVCATDEWREAYCGVLRGIARTANVPLQGVDAIPNSFAPSHADLTARYLYDALVTLTATCLALADQAEELA